MDILLKTKAQFAIESLDQTTKTLEDKEKILDIYSRLSNETILMLRIKLEEFIYKYEQGYTKYLDQLKTASDAAEEQQKMFDIVAGVAIGVGVGLISPALAGVVGLKKGLSLLHQAQGEGFGEVGESIVGLTTQNWRQPAGIGIQSTENGKKPSVIKATIYKMLFLLIKEISDFRSETDGVFKNVYKTLSKIDHTLRSIADGKADEKLLNGKTENKTLQELLIKVQYIESLNRKMDFAKIWKEIHRITVLKSMSAKFPVPSTRLVEQNIWLVWISSLSDFADYDEYVEDKKKRYMDPSYSFSTPIKLDNSNNLRAPGIEDYLEKIHVLGWDDDSRTRVEFGRYRTTAHDRFSAIKAARREVEEIKKTYKSINGLAQII